MQSIHYMTAIKRMREFTTNDIPFSFEFIKLNGEHKIVSSASLRSGYRNNQSKRAKYLIAYHDNEEGTDRQFHRALLIRLNGVNVTL